MKTFRFCLIVLTLALTLTALFGIATAETPDKSSDYRYRISADETVTITGYRGNATALVIPATIEGKAVTAISSSAFSGSDCGSLTSITIPSSVTAIGELAFFECFQLTEISVSLKNPTYASIDGVLFEKTTKTLLTCPAALSASSYTIPQGIRAIGDCAFSHCSSLTEITIPDSVTVIGFNPFVICPKLTDIVVSPNNPTFTTVDGVLFDKTTKTLLVYPPALSASSYTIPQGTSAIGDYPFAYCESLSEIVIPDSVTSTGEGVFGFCTALTEITIPDSVTAIGYSAFYNCTALTEITIPNSVTTIGDNAFANCTALTEITIPDSVTAIGDAAFANCTALTEITIPNSVTKINYDTFYNCSSLASITIPDSVNAIGHRAFIYCTALTEIAIPNSVTEISDFVFYNCSSLASVTIPDSVTSISDDAFYGCSEDLSFFVKVNSYAEKYAEEHGIPYTYYGIYDWLFN